MITEEGNHPMTLVNVNSFSPLDFIPYMHFIESQDQNTFNMFKDILMLNILLENGNADIIGDMYKKNINGIKTCISCGKRNGS